MNLLDMFEGREPHQQAIDKLEQSRIDHLKEKMDYYAKHGMLEQFRKAKEEHDSYFKVQDECMGYGGVVGEAGIGQDIANKQEKMARATPSTPASKVASTVKNAAKWLAGKGGPGREGPTYEDQKKNSKVAEGQRLHVGDPIIVTAPNEFEGKTGEISEFSPSGKFVIVNLYNHGEHSMHLSDVEYNQYADTQDEEDDWYDNQEDTLEEANVNPKFINAQVTKILAGEARRMTNAPVAQLLAPLMQQYGLTLQQIDSMVPGGLRKAAGAYGIMMKEGWSNKMVAQRTGQAVANKLRAKFKAEGRDPSVITIAATDYDKGIEEEQKPLGFGEFPPKQEITIIPPKKLKSGETYQDRNKYWQSQGQAPIYKTNEAEGQTDYSKRRQRERDVDTGKPVARQRQPRMTDYQKRRAQQKKEMELGEDYNNETRDAVESAIIRRIMVSRTDLLKKFGPQKVMDAAQAVADEHSDVEEIGTSDVSAFVQQVERYLAMNY